jgi:hypothetical protein
MDCKTELWTSDPIVIGARTQAESLDGVMIGSRYAFENPIMATPHSRRTPRDLILLAGLMDDTVTWT